MKTVYFCGVCSRDVHVLMGTLELDLTVDNARGAMVLVIAGHSLYSIVAALVNVQQDCHIRMTIIRHFIFTQLFC